MSSTDLRWAEDDRRQEVHDTPRRDASQASGRTFLDHLSIADQRALTQVGLSAFYPAGKTVFLEGEPGDALYVVWSGRVAVRREEENGTGTVLAYRGPGEILGEMSLIEDRPRSATVTALEDSELLRIGRSDFRALLRNCPTISQAILNTLTDRLRIADTARTAVLRQEEDLSDKLEELAQEAQRLTTLTRLRQETVDSIVHDLRSPLNVVSFCLEMLEIRLTEEAYAQVAEYLELAHDSIGRLFDLANVLLEAARQEAMEVPPAPRTLDLIRLLRTSVQRARVIAEPSTVEIVLQMSEDLPEVQGDLVQLERVMHNLLDNAVYHSPEAGTVVVSAENTGSCVEVSVIDAGPGVPAGYREHIFDRFARLQGTDRGQPGFGLGLYTSRQIVRGHGGQIWVEPGPNGQGSRFVFTLPV